MKKLKRIMKKLKIKDYKDPYDIEDRMLSLFEGILRFEYRELLLIIYGEKNAYNFYKFITNPKSGWFYKIEESNSEHIRLEKGYWMAPHGIKVIIKIRKK